MVWSVFMHCVFLKAQSNNATYGIRLNSGLSVLQDQTVKNQFGIKPNYGCSLFGSFVQNKMRFGFEFGFENKGSYNKPTAKYIQLNYWFLTLQPLIKAISLKEQLSIGVYGAFLPYRVAPSTNVKYDYQFKTFDWGIDLGYSYKWLEKRKMPFSLILGSRYSLMSIYDNNNQGPYVPLTSRESNWTRNFTISVGIGVVLN